MTTVLILLAIIIIVVLIAGWVSGKEMNIERNINIKKSVSEVYDYLVLVRNQDNFSVWNMDDPNMKKDFIGTDGTVGCVYSWDSSTNKNVGAGEQEILSLEKDKSITYEVRFKRPMKNVAKCGFVLSPVSANETNVLWGFYSPAKFPLNLMKGMMEKMLGKDLQKSLENLKTLLEG
jgi:Polyketide cyclase / dehydrase and lipid transport.